jgi:hypothetical protein
MDGLGSELPSPSIPINTTSCNGQNAKRVAKRSAAWETCAEEKGRKTNERAGMLGLESSRFAHGCVGSDGGCSGEVDGATYPKTAVRHGVEAGKSDRDGRDRSDHGRSC